MAMIKCSDCATEISDKAKVCPKCGAPVVPKKKSGLLSKVFIGFVAIVAVSSAFRSCDETTKPSGAVTSTSVQSAAATLSAQKKDFWKKVDAVNGGLQDMNLNAVKSIATAGVIADLFSVGADLIRDSKNMQLTAPEQARLATMRANLVKRQVEVFPILRKKAGPLLSKALWEVDTTAQTFGDRYTTVEFVAGEFAAHRRIQSAEDAIYPVLMRLRFKHANYKWIPSADQYTQYNIDSPADKVLAEIDHQGAVVLAN